MSGFRDIHTHVLYGVDDGAKTRADMEAMLDLAHENGVVHLYATSHVTPGVYPFDWAVYEQRLDEARAYCRQKGYPMELHAGAEIMVTPMIKRSAKERTLPVLGETSSVLAEFVPDVAFEELAEAVSLMERCGYDVILAHAERYDCLFKKKNAYRLKEMSDVRYQMNCSTVIEKRGFFKDRKIRKWLKDGLVSFIASDAHSCRRRPCRMREAYDVLKEMLGEEEALRMTCGSGEL